MTSAVSEVELAPNEKRCTGCKEVKDRGEFSKRSRTKDGLDPRCKICLYAENKGRVDRARISKYDGLEPCPVCNRKFISLPHHTLREHNIFFRSIGCNEDEKRCKDCGAIKKKLEFHPEKSSADKLRVICKSCFFNRRQEREQHRRNTADENLIPCPFCSRSFTNLISHATLKHGKNGEDLKNCGVDINLSPLGRNLLSEGAKVPHYKARVGDTVKIIKRMITFPKSYWPKDCKYVIVKVDKIKKQIEFNPTNKQLKNAKSVQFSATGYRCKVQVHSYILDGLPKVYPIYSLRKGAGFRIEPTVKDNAIFDLFAIWARSGYSLRNTADLRIYPNGHYVSILKDLWPINAEHAYLEYNFYGVKSDKWCLDIIPVSRTGFIVGANKLNFKQYLGLDDCYKVRLKSDRFQISPKAFLEFNNIFPGDWRLKEVLSSGALRFVSSEKTGRKPQPMQTPDGTFEDWLTEIGENDSQPKEQSEDIAS